MHEPPASDDDKSGEASRANRALVLVSLSVLLASGTWLSGSSVAPSLEREWDLSEAESAWLTIAVQLGFLTGTFLYAVTNLADVFNARRVFFVSAIAGAVFNALFAWTASGLPSGIAFRFLTGLTLAGVYPVGMKIVASWFRDGLGWRLGVMVGALVLGTASAYFVRWWGAAWDWQSTVAVASGVAVAGGILVIVAVPDGPHLRSRARFDWQMMGKVFAHPPFRWTAFGYFGHMWELYAFWTLLVHALTLRSQQSRDLAEDHISLVAFVVIAVGIIGCVVGGWVSRQVGERRVALVSLVISALCCLLSGWLFALPIGLWIAVLIVWGVFVVSDSPQFSALAARHCPPEYTGTALTVQNGVGFAISVGSIQLLPLLATDVGWQWVFLFLAIGPIFGAWSMMRLRLVEPD